MNVVTILRYRKSCSLCYSYGKKLINSNNSIQPPYGTVKSARRKCSLRYSYVALVSDQEFCSFEEEPEMG